MNNTYDIIVCGGGLSGCFAAICSARAGFKTVLIERNTFLGSEMTATLKLWLNDNGNFERTPEDIKQIFGRNSLISCADLKLNLLSLLQSLGVKVLFMSSVSGILVSDNAACGLMISNKYGNQLIYAKSIIDTTSTVFNMAEKTDSCNTDDIFSIVMRYAKVSENCGNEVIFPENFGIENNKAFLHFGSNRTKPYVEIFLRKNDINITDKIYESVYKIETSIRRIDPSFQNAELMQFSSKPIVYGRKPIYRQGIKYKNIIQFHIGSLPKSAVSYDDLTSYFYSAKKAVNSACLENANLNNAYIVNQNISIPLNECVITRHDDFKLDIYIDNITFDAEKYLPVLHQCQVMIAGGGTAGVAAAIGASKTSDNVMVAEYFSGFGGTQSLGLVGNYYHGYVDGFAAMQTYNMCHAGLPRNAVGRLIWYYMDLRKNNISLLSNTVICGSIIKNRKCHGVIASYQGKIGIIKADVTVDSTGDSDVLSFCNGQFRIGSLRDGSMQNSSQWEIYGKDYDLDIFDQTKYSDILRGLYMTHAKNSADDFSPMLTPRESRRFIGEYTITMRDVLCSKYFDDCICIARTDCDPHGAMSSLFYYMGLTPYHDKIFEVKIPYRACIPKNMDGLLVASKSISATQDASAYLRMACDVQNRGYAVGTAAAMAATNGIHVKDVNVEELKLLMLHIQIITKKHFEIKTESINIKNKIEQLKNGDTDILTDILCLEKAQVFEHIEKEFLKTHNLNLALALGWFGSQLATDTLIDALLDLSENEDFYDDTHPFKIGNNKGGIIGKTESYWKVNQILTVLGMIGDKRCINAVCKVLNNADAGGKPERNQTRYVSGRMDLQKIPHYDRIRCLCFCIEKIADPTFIKPLEILFKKPYLSGYITNDLHVSGQNSQSVYIELIIARTLARCGSVNGLKKLIELLSDSHYYIAKNALDEICSVAGNLKNAKSMLEKGLNFDPIPYISDGYEM